MSDYKAIAQELTEHPERWHAGNYSNEAGTAHCLVEHIHRRAGGFLASTSKYFRAAAGPIADRALSVWNDHRGRTVEDVIALCKRVAGVEQ